jgi:hypothetical protein
MDKRILDHLASTPKSNAFEVRNSMIARRKLFPKFKNYKMESATQFDPSKSFAESEVALDNDGLPIDFGITLVARKPNRRINLNAPPRKLKTRLNYFDGI